MVHEGGQTHTEHQEERPGPVKPAWQSGATSLVHLQGSDPGKADDSRLPKKQSFQGHSETKHFRFQKNSTSESAQAVCATRRKHTHVPLTHAGHISGL